MNRVPSAVSTLVVLLALSFVLLSNRNGGKIADGRKIKISDPTAEANPKLENIPFDPLVAEFEEEQDDHAWEHDYFKLHHEEMHAEDEHSHHHGHDEHDGTFEEDELEVLEEEDESIGHTSEEEFDKSELEEDYFEEDHFNMKERLEGLFPLIDTHADHMVTEDELLDWQLRQARHISLHRTDRELKATDRNKNGLVSLEEYLDENFPKGVLRVEGHDLSEDHKQTMIKRFPLADSDKDGQLNREEFNDFLHPEDSNNDDLHRHTWEIEIKHRDQDKDGKLGFQDFVANMYDEMVRYSGDEDEVEDAVHLHGEKSAHEVHSTFGSALKSKSTKAKKVFEELDGDHDGFLQPDDLAPVIYMLLPNEYHFSLDRTKEMIQQADSDKDGKLSLQEMQDHAYVFYNTVLDHHREEEGLHDEF